MIEARTGGVRRVRSIVFVLGAALAARAATPLAALAVARPAPQFREPDSDGYVRLAKQLLEAGCFGAPGRPEIVRTPGYPLVLLSGVAAGHVEAVTIGLQVVLGCLTVWLVYRTSLLLFGHEEAALAAAWLAACEPLSIVYASKLLSETSFTALLAAVAWLLVRYSLWRRWGDLLAAAATIAAAAYVRPIAFFLPGWVGLTLLVVFWRHAARRWRLGLQAAAFLALALALLAPWQIRNSLAAGYRGFAAISDVNLYYYEALPVLADGRGIGPGGWQRMRAEAGEADEAAYLRQHPEQADWPPARRFRFLRGEALRIIRSDPLGWARIHLAGIAHTLGDSGRNAWLAFFRLAEVDRPAAPAGGWWQRLLGAARERPLVLAIHGLLATILFGYFGLALVGAASPASRTPAMLVVVSLAAYLLLLSGGAAGYHRFRLPLTPILCLLAGEGYRLLVRLPLLVRLARNRHA